MIKALIIDVDGVIIGEKVGVNFPIPHPDVISQLKAIGARGIPIALCTAKPYFAIQNIVEAAELHSLHITNGGGVITDPLDSITLRSHTIDKDFARKIIATCIDAGVYVEAYGLEEYAVQTSQQSDITTIHTDILQREPLMVPSLLDYSHDNDIVKIMPVATDDDQMHHLNSLMKPWADQVSITWGSHPIALPRRFGIITAKGISKQQATRDIADHFKLEISDILGIGDSTSDWQFIEQCGYAGAMGNASKDLKRLVSLKGDQSFIGRSVDENGILDILKYFRI